jgi:tRNA U34 5-methylaminomethyl-2-thiouridine-forming methyltransferase MnmC
MFIPPTDLIPLLTADGSFTLESRRLGERYHSRHGAAAESRHVYIEMGLRARRMEKLDLLEVGLGTGLNALLTWMETEVSGTIIDYHALEPWPLTAEAVSELGHPQALGQPGMSTGFDRMMRLGMEGRSCLSPRFTFQCSTRPVQELEAVTAFDLVYFDAFAPAVQPEMWGLNVFQRLHRAMRPGAVLVTYCAKGAVRRTLVEAGFAVERLKGPPGKLEMLRATRTA